MQLSLRLNSSATASRRNYIAAPAVILSIGTVQPGNAQAGGYRLGETGYHWYRYCVGPHWLYPHQSRVPAERDENGANGPEHTFLLRRTFINAMASFRFSTGITRRWHKPAELLLHKLGKSDGLCGPPGKAGRSEHRSAAQSRNDRSVLRWREGPASLQFPAKPVDRNMDTPSHRSRCVALNRASCGRGERLGSASAGRGRHPTPEKSSLYRCWRPTRALSAAIQSR
jgi:hypothetical protein